MRKCLYTSILIILSYIINISSDSIYSLTDSIDYDVQIIQTGKCIGKNTTCSPVWCHNADNPACDDPEVGETVDMVQYVNNIPCKSCEQSHKDICKSDTLLNVLKINSGLTAVYCNDKYLVLYSNGAPNHKDGLSYVPQPPGGEDVVYSSSCVARSYNQDYLVYKVPLYPVLLPTASQSNNIEAFNGQSGTEQEAIPGYGLPSSGPIGVTISGMPVFPLYNNEGVISHERCEVDKCSAHAGKGFDYHYHGDPFSPDESACLYSPSDYESQTSHPPVIGWSFDGYSVYGRHLYSTSLGFSKPLDVCGGHTHADSSGVMMEYHYHAQVQYKRVDMDENIDESYYAYIGGVYQCWRGNISVAEFFGNFHVDTIEERADYNSILPCCNTKESYLTGGIKLQSSPPTSQITVDPYDSKSLGDIILSNVSIELIVLGALVILLAICITTYNLLAARKHKYKKITSINTSINPSINTSVHPMNEHLISIN